jgi:hypothetical protein
MVINKLIQGLQNALGWQLFTMQYHLLADLDPHPADLDHVIVKMLTFESTMRPRRTTQHDARQSNFRSEGQGNFRDNTASYEECSACGKKGHSASSCWTAHSEQRPSNG